ncbi:MAG: hypothetical protein J7M38_02900, partial [Armatimonadetes bacterium]|nr:hypothetical protein [Armatimonadota bacterium]
DASAACSSWARPDCHDLIRSLPPVSTPPMDAQFRVLHEDRADLRPQAELIVRLDAGICRMEACVPGDDKDDHPRAANLRSA